MVNGAIKTSNAYEKVKNIVRRDVSSEDSKSTISITDLSLQNILKLGSSNEGDVERRPEPEKEPERSPEKFESSFPTISLGTDQKTTREKPLIRPLRPRLLSKKEEAIARRITRSRNNIGMKKVKSIQIQSSAKRKKFKMLKSNSSIFLSPDSKKYKPLLDGLVSSVISDPEAIFDQEFFNACSLRKNRNDEDNFFNINDRSVSHKNQETLKFVSGNCLFGKSQTMP